MKILINLRKHSFKRNEINSILMTILENDSDEDESDEEDSEYGELDDENDWKEP